MDTEKNKDQEIVDPDIFLTGIVDEIELACKLNIAARGVKEEDKSLDGFLSISSENSISIQGARDR